MTQSEKNPVAKKGAKANVAVKPHAPAAARPAIRAKARAAVPKADAAPAMVVDRMKPPSAVMAEMIEAAPSPATTSDSMAAPAIETIGPAPVIEEVITMANVSNDAAQKAQAMLGDFSNRFTSAFAKSSKLSEEMVEFAKGNVEAMIASSKVAAKASESMGHEAAEYGKKHFEAATAAFKSFATVKSPTELFQLQSEFAKAAFDSMVAEASRVSESMMKVAGEVAQPLSNRYALAAEKIKSAAL